MWHQCLQGAEQHNAKWQCPVVQNMQVALALHLDHIFFGDYACIAPESGEGFTISKRYCTQTHWPVQYLFLIIRLQRLFGYSGYSANGCLATMDKIAIQQ